MTPSQRKLDYLSYVTNIHIKSYEKNASFEMRFFQ
jgi:hypothetical protein